MQYHFDRQTLSESISDSSIHQAIQRTSLLVSFIMVNAYTRHRLLVSQPNSNIENEMDLFIRHDNGKTSVVTAYHDDEISVLQKRIDSKRCKQLNSLKQYVFCPSDQYLTYQSKPLADSLTIGDYGIQHGDTLFVADRQRGGCFMVSLSILFTIFLAILMSFCTCGLSLTIVPFLIPLLAVLPLFCL